MDRSCASQLQQNARPTGKGLAIVLCGSSTGAVAEPTAGRWEATHCCSPWGLPSASWLWHAVWLVTAFLSMDEEDAMHPALLPQMKPSLADCLVDAWMAPLL